MKTGKGAEERSGAFKKEGKENEDQFSLSYKINKKDGSFNFSFFPLRKFFGI